MGKEKKESKKELERGVYVIHSWKANENDDPEVMAFIGTQYAAELTQNSDLVLIEMEPDVLNKNNGEPVPRIRRFINKSEWAECIIV
jgi:hypothetical protein